MDYQLFRFINGLAEQRAWLDGTLTLVAMYASFLFVAALVWLWGIRGEQPGGREDRLAVGRALASAAIALGLGQLIIHVYARPRPFVGHAVRLLIPPTTDPSFPSDHALAAFAIAAALVSTRRRLGLGLFGLAALLAFARVFVGTHYPLDVMGGAILGTGVGVLMHKGDAWLAPLVALTGRWTDAATARMWRPTAARGSPAGGMAQRIESSSGAGNRGDGSG